MLSVDEIAEYLFARASGEVYAVLDAARDERILPNLERSGADYTCLYTGAPKELAAVAPYLTRLRPWASFTDWLFRAGWAQSWGVFVTTRAGVEELRLHLKRHLMVQDERGKQLYFRYYDPRVLRLYLPTCTAAERGQIFGPVERYWSESREGYRLIEHHAGGEVEEREVNRSKRDIE